MDEEKKRSRKARYRKYVEDAGGIEDLRKQRARERRAAYIERLKAQGKYEEFKRRKVAYEKRRIKEEPDYQKLKLRERQTRWRKKMLNWPYVMHRNALWRSRAKNLPFDIEKTDIVVPEVCPVLGIKLEKAYGRMADNSPSLDRVRPELGYVKGNVRVISQRANRLKCDATAAELKLVYEDLLRLEAT